MKRWNNFQAVEGEIVWAHRTKFKDESKVDYETSTAPKIMPYLILKHTDNKYYALLVSNRFKRLDSLFTLTNKKYNSLNRQHYVRLSEIFELEQLDIVEHFYNIKVCEKDFKMILNKIMILIIRSKSLFTNEEINIFKQIYDKYNPMDVGSIVKIKENDQIKQYLIVKEKNNKEKLGVNCMIDPNSEVNINNIKLNFADSKTILNKQTLYLKQKKGLSLEEVMQILDLKMRYYNKQANDDKSETKDTYYEIGSIIRINNYDYIIVFEDDKNYYVISYQNRNWVGGTETLVKKYLNCEYIAKMENTELLNILLRIRCQYNNYIFDKHPKSITEIEQSIKILEKMRNT